MLPTTGHPGGPGGLRFEVALDFMMASKRRRRPAIRVMGKGEFSELNDNSIVGIFL